MTRQRQLVLVVVLVMAAGLRLGHFAAVHDQPFFADLAMDSQAYDLWAQEIAAGDWLGETTFYQAPLYPYFLAVVYALFGVGYDAVYLLQILAAIAGIWALYRAGRALAGPSYGIAAGALAALYAPFPFYDVQLVKESFAVTATCFLLWALIAGRGTSRPASTPDTGWAPAWPWWWLAGFATGVLILLRENTFLVLPLLVLLAIDRRQPRASAVRASALVAGVVLLLLPIAVRNGVVGGTYLPTTFQGGTAFYQGNHPGASGTYEPMTPGRHLPRFDREASIRRAEEAVGHALSDAEVSSYWLGQSLTWARQDPLDFARLQWRKLAMFWRVYEWPDAVDYYAIRLDSPVLRWLPFELGGILLLACAGLWLRREHLMHRDLPVILFILGWTVSTIAFFVLSRYRMPMVPALILLAAEPVQRAVDALSTARTHPAHRRKAMAWGLLLVAAVVVPKVTMPAPNLGMHHYNLGVMAMQRGDAPAADEHFRAALQQDSDFVLPMLNLGRLATQRRDAGEAERWFLTAIEIEPESDDVAANLGALYLATGRADAARTWLTRALQLNARHVGALQNAVLLETRAGDGPAARAHLDALLLVAPDLPTADRLRQRVEAAFRAVPPPATDPVP